MVIHIPTEEKKDYEFNTNIGLATWRFSNGRRMPYEIAEIRNFIYDPIRWNKEIRDLCWWAYNANGVITNVVDYMCSIPTLDRIIFTKDRKKQTFENARRLFSYVLDEVRDKEIVRDSILKCCNDGIAFYYFIDEELPDLPRKMSNYQIQGIVSLNARYSGNYFLKALPVDYCKIVGFKNSSYQIEFDLSYFRQMITTGQMYKLKGYPKEIRDGVKEYMRSGSNTNQWLKLDNTKTIVVKIRSKQEEPWGRPLALAALEDILYRDYFLETKRNTLDEINNRLIYQEFPEGKEKGTSALTQEQQHMQHDTVKTALNNRQSGKWSVAFVSLAAGSKISKLDVNTDILKDVSEDSLFDRIAGDVGFAASLLNGSSKGTYAAQQTNLELISSQIFTWVRQFQAELNKVINLNVIQDSNMYVETSYLPITLSNRNAMVTNLKDLYTLGKGSFQAWVTAVGLPYDAYLAMMDDELNSDFENRYPVHQTSYTMSSNSAGRPVTENPTNESTLATRQNGGNLQPRAGEASG